MPKCEVREKLVTLDPDTTVSHLVGMWKRGEKNEVIDFVWDSAPHVAAFFMGEAIKDGVLRNVSECNILVNGLMDRFVAWRDQS